MTTSTTPPLPESPILPVTVERLTEILDAEGLEYLVKPQIVETGAPNTALRFSLLDGVLTAHGLWRGTLAAADAVTALLSCNTWNKEHTYPTVTLMSTQPAGSANPSYTIAARRTLLISKGASRHQLGAFLVDTYAGVLDAFASVEKVFPQAVTWKESHV